jgi:hypothetical protein
VAVSWVKVGSAISGEAADDNKSVVFNLSAVAESPQGDGQGEWSSHKRGSRVLVQ